MNQQNNGFVKVHQPCWCGEGSDNTGINADGSAYCFTCQKYNPNYTEEPMSVDLIPTVVNKTTTVYNFATEFSNIPDRKLSEETCRTYDVSVTKDVAGNITHHHYPFTDADGTKVSIKTRRVSDKFFSIEKKDGRTHGDSVLFGQDKFKKGGKFLTITEGELDAMAAHQMTGNKYAFVSLRNGAGSAVKDIKNSLEYIESFETVVLCFDQDEPGLSAAKAVAKLITPGKCKVMSLPQGSKDASDMLKANKSGEFYQCFWKAELYIPSGILKVSENLDKYFNERPNIKGIPYPWQHLNRFTYGMRKGELVTWTAGTGAGKSTISRELEHYLLTNTQDKIGIVALEENFWRTIDGIIAIEANTRLHIPQVRDQYPVELHKELGEKLLKNDRLYVHSHLGMQDFDDLMSKIRYLAIGCECDWIFVDHLHMLVSMCNGVDERQIIDEVMLKLVSLVEETGVGMHLVSHLRKAQGVGHENGLQVTLSDLRGSNSIGQLSHMVISLERDQQGEENNVTTMRVLKNRPIGDTGKVGYMRYHSDTGRLVEIDEALEFEQEEF